MVDCQRFETYLTRLYADVYAQPPDDGHTAWAVDAVRRLGTIPKGIVNVLDVGCGQGFLASEFKKIGLAWTGVTLGEDYLICQEKGLNVHNADMSFLPFEDKSYDLVFARHVLEHSPFPVITLMEWKRVCRGWLVLVAPAPDHWGWRGRNHYSITQMPQLKWWLARAGWRPMHEEIFTNRDPAFIRFWQVYQDAFNRGGKEAVKAVLTANPPVDVEYRLLCEPIEPEKQ